MESEKIVKSVAGEKPMSGTGKSTTENSCTSELIDTGKICPYCNKPSKYVDSEIIYGKSYGMVYYCGDCRAWVGVHKGTDKALGRLANKELRDWKIKAHDLFDKMWMVRMQQGYSKNNARNMAYRWLSEQLNLTIDKTHIGMFDVDQCKKVVDLCQRYITRKA